MYPDSGCPFTPPIIAALELKSSAKVLIKKGPQSPGPLQRFRYGESDNLSFRTRMIPLGSIRGDTVAASGVFRVLFAFGVLDISTFLSSGIALAG